MSKEILEFMMSGYCTIQNRLNEEVIEMLIKYVNANGGEINTTNEGDYHLLRSNDTIYGYVYDESNEYYRDFQIDKVKVDIDSNGEEYLSIHIYWEEFEEEDNWYRVDGGLVLVTPTLYNLCECLHEYVD